MILISAPETWNATPAQVKARAYQLLQDGDRPEEITQKAACPTCGTRMIDLLNWRMDANNWSLEWVECLVCGTEYLP